MVVESEEYEKEVLEMAVDEEDELVRKFANGRKTAMLALIAPYAPLKISPTRTVSAELGPFEEFAIESFIIKARKMGIMDSLYLLLHSPGGGIESAYAIAKTLRKNFKQIITLVPQVAASGATLIALCSNKIIMGEIGRLSPIDIQIFSKGERKSALALLRGFSKLDKRFETTSQEDISYPYRHLIESIDLTTFEEWSGVLDGMEGYATEFLRMAGYDPGKCAEIATKLVYGFSSHNEVIDFGKASELGLKVEWYEDCKEEWAIVRRWFSKYLLKEAGFHHVIYALPEG